MSLLELIDDADQDFEWYPTTDRMIAAVTRHLSQDCASFLDIGAGDGRVLLAFRQKCPDAELYAIEKSAILLQAHPASITPVGVDFHEQNLSSLPVATVFSNPPYSEYESWVTRIIETAYAERAFLVIPQRWKDNDAIARALAKREATARVIHSDDFSQGERRARAVIDIVEVRFPLIDESWRSRKPIDPFDVWFDQNISTFDLEEKIEDPDVGVNLARLRGLKSIVELVDAFNEDYDRMEQNYRAIFTLDYAILRELGVNKAGVRDGLKKRMAGLKTLYWEQLFDKLDVITNRLSTQTKRHFLERLTARTSIAFTVDNAHAIVLWAIKHANAYFDEQLITLFHDLATFAGVAKYKSNTKTWEKSGWRYNAREDKFSHYALDYRIVIERHAAIFKSDFGRYDYPGDLHTGCHELIDDMIAVFGNLGFFLPGDEPRSRARQWTSNSWQDFTMADGRTLFQVKAFQNGNLHLRMLPAAIRTLNVEAGRLLGWLHSPADVVQELGYTPDEATALFGATAYLPASSMRLLAGTAGT